MDGGGIEHDRLRRLVDDGLSIRRIAAELGVSYTTVRYWLAKHGITTPRARRLAETAPARLAGAETTVAECPTHGVTTFIRRGADGFRCRLCRTGAVQRRRREVERILVEEAGGACVLCGYDRTLGGLHFHHRDHFAEGIRALPAGRHAVAGVGAGGGREVRTAVLELPCGG